MLWAICEQEEKERILLIIINKLNYKLQAQNRGTIGRRYRE